MFSRFFIDRPIFASVLSIVIALAGGITVLSLPIAQYPEIAPPTVQVSSSYPGANAQVVADTVAAPIEQQVNGVENMIYMMSQCTNDGSYNLTCTFAVGSDLNIALVQVQNRVQLAMPQLPEQVQRQGVNIKKKAPSILLCVNLISRKGRYDATYLSNYAAIQIQDELFRCYGVGDIVYLGQRQYSIRSWLDPKKLATRNLTANDVANAVRNQNRQVVSGQLGSAPARRGLDFQPTVQALGQLTTPEQFGDVIVKAGASPAPPGSDRYPTSPDVPLVRLRDLSRIELGAQDYDQSCTLDKQPSVALAIFQLPGTNALQTAEGIRAKMEELKTRFPEDLDYEIVYDTTPFIGQSIDEVFKTLRDAIILVAIVVLVFLQNWRATLIPLVAVPVALLGTFAVLAAFGFSLNNLSLFGLVLAVGIVVDDAIVVVENVERWMGEGLPAREAAARAMEEVTGPVVAVALVLCAVFVPCAFISGITGQFFRQFALTIAASTVISAFNSLTLSPALAALLLKPHGTRKDFFARALDVILGWFFRLFNRGFDVSTGFYVHVIGLLLRGSVIVLLAYAGLLALTGWSFATVPAGFIPQQDQGYLIVNLQLPDSASVQRTEEAVRKIETICHETKGVKHTIGISGMSVLYNANSPNFGSLFVILDDFPKRVREKRDARTIALELNKRFYDKVREAEVRVFGAPPIQGLGTAGGFKLMIEDRGNLGLDALQETTDAIIRLGENDPRMMGLFTPFRANMPQLYLDIDRVKARAMEVELKDVFDTLQIYMGAMYVNNFTEFGRTWQVNLMADGQYRNHIDDVGQLKVRNKKGEMIPLATFIKVKSVGGPVMVVRYNLYPSAPINGVAMPGTSSGESLDLMNRLADEEMPWNMTREWTDLMYQQIVAGNTAMYVFALAVVLVFLVLAAQYESWTLPLAVILVVPMCLLCSILGVMSVGLDMDIFVQIGFVVLVGLASKNAILIVEFAKLKRESGSDTREATLEACRLRLRPILMTSFAFILGVVPLVLAEGAGAEMRKILGLAVFSGMLGVTIFGVFLTPVFFFSLGTVRELAVFASPKAKEIGRIARTVVLVLAQVLVSVLLGRQLLYRHQWERVFVLVGILGVVLYMLLRSLPRRRPMPPFLPPSPKPPSEHITAAKDVPS